MRTTVGCKMKLPCVKGTVNCGLSREKMRLNRKLASESLASLPSLVPA